VAGAVLQLLSPPAVQRIGSLRTWVVLTTVVQALSYVPLILAALLGRVPLWLVFVAPTVYWASGMSSGPAWSTWAGRLVPSRLLAVYFSKRAGLCQVCLLLGLVAGGLILQEAKTRGLIVPVFAALFGAALLSRLASSWCLASQTEPPMGVSEHRRVTFWEMGRRIRHGADGRLLIYLIVMQTMSQIATPYFTPCLLSRIGFSYAAYMALVAIMYATKAAATPYLGRLAQRLSPYHVLGIGAIGIVPLPALWLVSSTFSYLLVLQIAAGVAWAAHELATSLRFFKAIREDERTSVLTTYNFFNSLATVGGALVGGFILHTFGNTWHGYSLLFAASTIGRAAAILVLVRVVTTGMSSSNDRVDDVTIRD
jgi:uncharacterized membrane protein YeaQ/YmgE (transglycosylase-associated protein family)